jgi:four helix bundle protein
MNNVLAEKSISFAKNIIRVYEYLKNIKSETVMSRQLLRSGTSIGANIHEANYAVIKPDFISKMQIALKECYEADYWLKLLLETNYLAHEEHSRLLTDCSEFRRMLTATCKTAKGINKIDPSLQE